MFLIVWEGEVWQAGWLADGRVARGQVSGMPRGGLPGCHVACSLVTLRQCESGLKRVVMEWGDMKKGELGF